MIHFVAHVLFAILSKIFAPIKVKGLRSIPRQGGFILASNHLSNLDPMILELAARRQLNYIAKESLFKNNISAFILTAVGAFPIKRNTSDVSAIKEALNRLKDGIPIVIFPEGTRKSSGMEKRVQPGVGLISIKAEVPVVPALISGSDKVLPAGAKFINLGRTPITVRFGHLIHFSKQGTYLEIAQKIMHEIEKLSESG